MAAGFMRRLQLGRQQCPKAVGLRLGQAPECPGGLVKNGFLAPIPRNTNLVSLEWSLKMHF